MSVLVLNDIKNKYVYPMSNSTNGGAIHSEYNIRSALSNLLSYSAANTISDFAASDFDYIKDTKGNYLKFKIAAGKGNCNSYFVSCDAINVEHWEFIDQIQFNANREIDEISGQALTPFSCYLCLSYNNNIADDLQLVIVSTYLAEGESNSQYDDVFSNYRSRGFNDIGIKLFSFDYCSRQYGEDGKTIEEVNNCINFLPNPNITRCIDLSRIGSQGGLLEELQNLIKELPTLNIFGGDLFVSDYGKDKDGKYLDNQNYRDIFGGDYRLRLHLEQAKDADLDEYILDKGTANEKRVKTHQFYGSLDFVKVDAAGFATKLDTILDFKTKRFDSEENYKPDKSEKWPAEPSIDEVTFTENKCVYKDIDVTNKLTVKKTETELIDVSSAATFNDKITIQTAGANKIDLTTINNNGATLNVAGNVKADKIFGAVWM